MTTYFITSSGTNIGKTMVTARLVGEQRKAGKSIHVIKPIITGFTWHGLRHNDTGRILAALGKEATPENVNAMSPWRFEEPLAPDMAARREGRELDFVALTAFCRDAMAEGTDTCLIEGVGGVMVPLDAGHTIADLIAALDVPSIVVVGSYLGTLSHSLTTIEAMRARKLPIAAIVVSESEDSPVPLDETADTISRFEPEIPVRMMPRRKFVDGEPDLLADLLD